MTQQELANKIQETVSELNRMMLLAQESDLVVTISDTPHRTLKYRHECPQLRVTVMRPLT